MPMRTRAEMADIIQRQGGSIMTHDGLIDRVQDLPGEADHALAMRDPEAKAKLAEQLRARISQDQANLARLVDIQPGPPAA